VPAPASSAAGIYSELPSLEEGSRIGQQSLKIGRVCYRESRSGSLNVSQACPEPVEGCEGRMKILAFISAFPPLRFATDYIIPCRPRPPRSSGPQQWRCHLQIATAYD